MDTPNEHTSSTHEREVIVTDGSRSASPVVAIVALIVFGILGYLLIGAFTGGDGEVDTSVPSVDVNVDEEAFAPGSTWS